MGARRPGGVGREVVFALPPGQKLREPPDGTHDDAEGAHDVQRATHPDAFEDAFPASEWVDEPFGQRLQLLRELLLVAGRELGVHLVRADEVRLELDQRLRAAGGRFEQRAVHTREHPSHVSLGALGRRRGRIANGSVGRGKRLELEMRE